MFPETDEIVFKCAGGTRETPKASLVPTLANHDSLPQATL